jgi:hypothetical protein
MMPEGGTEPPSGIMAGDFTASAEWREGIRGHSMTARVLEKLYSLPGDAGWARIFLARQGDFPQQS